MPWSRYSYSAARTINSILADHAEPMPLIAEEGQMETFIGEAMKGLISDSATKGPVTDAQVKAAEEASTCRVSSRSSDRRRA